MIQEIVPHIFNNQYKYQHPQPASYILCFEENGVFIEEFDGESIGVGGKTMLEIKSSK